MAKKEAKKKLYRCETCGRVSEKEEECCGEMMVDLSSNACMACKGCGWH